MSLTYWARMGYIYQVTSGKSSLRVDVSKGFRPMNSNRWVWVETLTPPVFGKKERGYPFFLKHLFPGVFFYLGEPREMKTE